MNGWVVLGRTAAFLTAAFAAGFWISDVQAARPPSLEAARIFFMGSGRPSTPTETFREHYGLIQANYFRKVDVSRLKNAAMEGMFQSLGDPHTTFLEPQIATSFAQETKGDFVGVGARLSPDPLGAKIMKVFTGSPADRAGIKVGDVVVKVNGSKSAGLPVDKIVEAIKGPEGSTVKISVLRKGQTLELNARRSKVQIPTAEGKMLPNQIGYLAVSGFSEVTPAQFDAELEALVAQDPKGIIMDLRGNPGGLLEAAASMLSRFVDGKLVVVMKGKSSGKTSSERGRVLPYSGEILLLVNDESASAAEIFAGVMREYGKARLVGDHTYGKASVQNVIPVAGGASAKITVARYYLPSGANISRVVDEEGQYVSGGLKPDFQVEFKIKPDAAFGEPGRDSQLDRAIEIIMNRGG